MFVFLEIKSNQSAAFVAENGVVKISFDFVTVLRD